MIEERNQIIITIYTDMISGGFTDGPIAHIFKP